MDALITQPLTFVVADSLLALKGCSTRRCTCAGFARYEPADAGMLGEIQPQKSDATFEVPRPTSDLGSLGQEQCVLGIDAKVPNGVLELGVAKQDLMSVQSCFRSSWPKEPSGLLMWPSVPTGGGVPNSTSGEAEVYCVDAIAVKGVSAATGKNVTSGDRGYGTVGKTDDVPLWSSVSTVAPKWLLPSPTRGVSCISNLPGRRRPDAHIVAERLGWEGS